MPPSAKRNCSVIIFDVNSSDKDKLLAALIKICTYKWLSCCKDTYQFILANTKVSDNDEKYKNIHDMGLTDLDPQSIYEYVANAEPEEGDWLDALLLGIHHLKKYLGTKGVITLQLLYLTTGDKSSKNADKHKIGKIIKALKDYHIYLYVLGPDIKLPFTILSCNDVYECMSHITVDETNIFLAASKKIVQETDYSVMCDLKVGINLFFSFAEPRGTQPWKVPLSFGSQLEIPCITIRVMKNEAPFKLAASGSKSKVVYADNESVEVDRADLVRGITRHGKFVQMENNESFKIEGPRSFSIVGFTNKKNVPEYYMHGEVTYQVLPDHEKEESCQAMYYLIDVLCEQEKYGIVKKVYFANSKPKYYVLIPRADLDPKCFVMAELPYSDDVSSDYKWAVPAVELMDEKPDNFAKFFTSLDIYSDDCKVNIPLGPMMMLDSCASILCNEAAKKYLNSDVNFEAVDINDLEIETNEFLDVLKEEWVKEDNSADDGDDKK